MRDFPKIFKIRQKIEVPRLQNVEKRVNELLDQFDLWKKVKKGERVGLTAGSRGIKDKPKVLKTIINRLKDLGASPFVVPCMGSHGGAIAEGQMKVLESLGITENSVGAPIFSSVEVEEIGRTKFGTPVFADEHHELGKDAIPFRVVFAHGANAASAPWVRSQGIALGRLLRPTDAFSRRTRHGLWNAG